MPKSAVIRLKVATSFWGLCLGKPGGVFSGGARDSSALKPAGNAGAGPPFRSDGARNGSSTWRQEEGGRAALVDFLDNSGSIGSISPCQQLSHAWKELQLND